MEWDDDERSLKSFKSYSSKKYNEDNKTISQIIKEYHDDEKKKNITYTYEDYKEEVVKRLVPEVYKSEPIKIIDEKPLEEEFNSTLMDNEIYKKFTYA
jgi:hypothetical protein